MVGAVWAANKRGDMTNCCDCGVDTDFRNGNGHHFYTLADYLWLAATPDGARFLFSIASKSGLFARSPLRTLS